MEPLKPPDHLRLTGNVQKNWALFKQKLELYLHATAPAKPLTEAAKTATLLTVAGDDALDVFNNFTFAEGENKEDYQTVIAKFEEYCAGQQNEVYERYVFRTRTQEEDEPAEQFLRDLRKQAKFCNFGQLFDSMIRDQIVFGTNNRKLREKMLREKDLTLEKAEHFCKAAETASKQSEAWKESDEKVDATTARQQRSSQSLKTTFQCFKCNRRHEPRKCPAFGKICRSCQGRNHFAICCKQQVGEVQRDDEGFNILDVSVCGIQKAKDWVVNAYVAEQEVALKVDTGSQANLLPLSVYKRFRTKPPLKPSCSVLRSYSGNVIKQCGVTTQVVKLGSRRCVAHFFVVKRSQAILGLQTAELLGLVSRTVDSVAANDAAYGNSATVVQEFAHLFEGTGCVQREYRMVLRDDSVPVVQLARRVPLALQEPLRKELQRMEKASIICKVDEPTDWFVPGKELVLADMLSRAVLADSEDSAGYSDVQVHAVGVLSSLVSEATKKRFAEETHNDPQLRAFVNSISSNKNVEGELKPFASELSVVDGILLKGCKVVVPKKLRPETLRRIHEGHLGVNKCKARARRLVFWPGMNSEIEDVVRKCSVCATYAYKQPSEPLLPRPTPDNPWYRVGVDLFHYAGGTYLAVFDAYSNFPEVEKLEDSSAATVTDKLGAIFARFGIPVEVCTDNGPQFSSHHFATFAKRYDFKHVTSSPEFPRSNGLAEKGVQITKRLLKKTRNARGDFWLGLLAYRSSPLTDGRSPGELLQGRRLRARLPDFNPPLRSPVKKHRQRTTGRTLQPLQPEQLVRIRGQVWSQRGKVLGEVAPRSYQVATENGTTLRRNRQHLRPTPEYFSSTSYSDDSDAECAPSHEPVRETSPRASPAPRRSTRATTQPRRLAYGGNFQQIS
ncbi:uncharacterized protein LOC144158324 [Haemaphysalis longicornis]